MNPYHICGHMKIQKVVLVMKSKGFKEVHIRITQTTMGRGKWYQLHAITQGGLDEEISEH